MFVDPLRNEEGSSSLARDFVYVGDCIAVIEWCLRTMDGSSGLNGIYNVGTGEAKTFDQVREAVIAAFSALTKIDRDRLRGGFMYGPMPRELVSQYQRFTKADISKLRAAGYIDRFQTLDEAVKETVGFYVA